MDPSLLIALGEWLKSADYRFVTVTPETHKRVLARRARAAERLTDVFGWSLPFDRDVVGPQIMDLMRAGDLAEEVADGRWRSRVRFSSLEGDLYAHSPFPTEATDSVFLGPDTYRFCRALRQAKLEPTIVVDIGCGTGAGGIVAGRNAEKVILVDINDAALVLAQVNAQLNGARQAETVKSDILAQVPDEPDLIVANPPYLRDPLARTYRDGGGEYGEGLALRIVEESLARLRRGGTLLLYTGTAIVQGEDQFFRAAKPLLEGARAEVRYQEIDPDVFGEELSSPSYAAVDRIAVVLLEAKSTR
jgi:SAM-dependent methyltransferase